MNQSDFQATLNIPQLIEAWRNGDQQAANDIFNRYQSRLLLLVSGKLNDRLRKRLDPEDLVQSIMRSAFRVTAERDIGFRDETGFWKWLTTVALNKTYNRIDHETTQKSDPTREVSGDSVLADRLLSEPTPDDVTEVAELLELIVARLNDIQAKILLARLDGLSHAEIAERLGVSTKTIQRNSLAIRQAAMEVLGNDVPDWLLPPVPTLAQQFSDCLCEPLLEWMPEGREMARKLQPKATLGEALFTDQPEMAVLDGVRSVAKLRGNSPDSPYPSILCAAIYLLSIAAARMRLGASLSADGDEKLQARARIVLDQDWLENRSRALLQEYIQASRRQ